MMVTTKQDTVNAPSADREHIHDLAFALANSLKECREYQEFIKARKALEADEENAAILNDLRQQQMSLHMASMLGEDVAEDNTDFENMFRLITQDPKISEYLFAEGRFFRLLAEVEKVFGDILGIWRLGDGSTHPAEHDIHLN